MRGNRRKRRGLTTREFHRRAQSIANAILFIPKSMVPHARPLLNNRSSSQPLRVTSLADVGSYNTTNTKQHPNNNKQNGSTPSNENKTQLPGTACQQASLSVSGSGNVLQEREDVNGGQSETLEFQSLIRVAGWELERGCCEMLEMLVA